MTELALPLPELDPVTAAAELCSIISELIFCLFAPLGVHRWDPSPDRRESFHGGETCVCKIFLYGSDLGHLIKVE
jgi:hypothetical protein